jgi:hypothetical protein
LEKPGIQQWVNYYLILLDDASNDVKLLKKCLCNTIPSLSPTLTDENRHPTPLQIRRHNLCIRLIEIMQQKPTQHPKNQRYPNRIPQLLLILRQWLAFRIQIPDHRRSDLIEVMTE